MEKFYRQFFEILKTSSEREFDAFRKLIINEINRESLARKGISVKKTAHGIKQKNIPDSVRPISSGKNRYAKRIKYLRFILEQKWEYLFDDYKLDEERKYYVYAHSDPTMTEFDISGLTNIIGIPFYIGKGCGDRHLGLTRNQGHDVKMRDILRKGCQKEKIVQIVKDNLTEREALALESKLIYLFQTVYENQLCGVLYNLDLGRRPDFDNLDSCVEKPSIIIRRKDDITGTEAVAHRLAAGQ